MTANRKTVHTDTSNKRHIKEKDKEKRQKTVTRQTRDRTNNDYCDNETRYGTEVERCDNIVKKKNRNSTAGEMTTVRKIVHTDTSYKRRMKEKLKKRKQRQEIKGNALKWQQTKKKRKTENKEENRVTRLGHCRYEC